MSQKIYQVALCVHSLNDWATGVLRGISDFVQTREDWCVFLNPLNPDNPQLTLEGWSGDGLITTAMNPEIRAQAERFPVPVVNAAGTLVDACLPSVIGNDALFGKVAAKHFLEQGFRHFACLKAATLHYGEVRTEGFKREAESWGGVVHESLDASAINGKTWTEQVSVISQWLSGLPRPLGVFCIFDELAHRVLEACHSSGITVPDEVAVIGVDNSLSLCLLSNPSLSSVSPDGRRRGRVVAEMLHHYMSRRGEALPAPDADILVETSPSGYPVWRVPPDGIRRRASTAAFAVEDPLVQKALELIAAETASGLHVDEVARRTGTSRRTLERRFHLALGRTVYSEIRRQRLESACRLLSETRKSILEVALDSGFQSASDLANAFRKHLDMKPGEYRERFRQV
ncbi:MAG: substrate-binding domain-containing protein [Verrucomicrobia bacterium]|nr:substrate-binding domain-containing protein [Verrucomicrobiota bacterium]MCH8511921.1 substrate-binding domain-containing protein [Kiritimatiellia bacterium]